MRRRGVEVRRDRALRLEGRIVKDREEDVLHDIARIGVVAQQAPGAPQHRVAVVAIQPFEGSRGHGGDTAICERIAVGDVMQLIGAAGLARRRHRAARDAPRDELRLRAPTACTGSNRRR